MRTARIGGEREREREQNRKWSIWVGLRVGWRPLGFRTTLDPINFFFFNIGTNSKYSIEF